MHAVVLCSTAHTELVCGLHVQLVQGWSYKELDHQQNRQEVCLTTSADTGYSLVTRGTVLSLSSDTGYSLVTDS